MDTSKMRKLERLQTMEALWDSLIRETPEIESPEWHRDILAGRKKLKQVRPNSSQLMN